MARRVHMGDDEPKSESVQIISNVASAMIRDPSDGSVKEPVKPEITGLPELKKDSDERERLERAREWLREWNARNGK